MKNMLRIGCLKLRINTVTANESQSCRGGIMRLNESKRLHIDLFICRYMTVRSMENNKDLLTTGDNNYQQTVWNCTVKGEILRVTIARWHR